MPLLHITAAIFLLLGLVCSTAAASCHIFEEWSTEVAGRDDQYVYGILPSPYCSLLSTIAQNGTGQLYALNVQDGSVAWRWPSASMGYMAQGVRLLPSASPDHVYALASFQTGEDRDNASLCAVVAALNSGNGTAIWQHRLCFPTAYSQPNLAVMQPSRNDSQGERILLAVGSTDTHITDYTLVDILNSTTGSRLSSAKLSVNMMDWTIQSVNRGQEGYFIIDTVESNFSVTPTLYQLTKDNEVKFVSVKPFALIKPLLYSQPSLHYDGEKSQVVAWDVATDDTVWASEDPFLIGVEWGNNNTFSHYSTSYQLIDRTPGTFLVLNAAFDNNHTAVAQAGIYQLSDGKQVARSPILTFDHLYHPEANPTTWQFDQILLLRGDTVWYTLHLPTLKLINEGLYATTDASLQSNNWLVDADGSYVALFYGPGSVIHGYPPFVNNNVEMETLQPAGVQYRRPKGAQVRERSNPMRD